MKYNIRSLYRYILSLALADLLVILTNVPFTSIIYTLDTWPWGELVCKLCETAKDISIGVSVFTLTALSADRFFAIVDPLKKLHATGESFPKLLERALVSQTGNSSGACALFKPVNRKYSRSCYGAMDGC